jgi:hypothetical protein
MIDLLPKNAGRLHAGILNPTLPFLKKGLCRLQSLPGQTMPIVYPAGSKKMVSSCTIQLAAFIEVLGAASKQMRQVCTKYIYFAGFKGMHAVTCQQGALAAFYPGYLYFGMAVQVRIKVFLYLFLHNYGLPFGHGYGKRQYFHEGI